MLAAIAHFYGENYAFQNVKQKSNLFTYCNINGGLCLNGQRYCYRKATGDY